MEPSGALEDVAEAVADVTALIVVEERRELRDDVIEEDTEEDEVSEDDEDFGTLFRNAGSGPGVPMVAVRSLRLSGAQTTC